MGSLNFNGIKVAAAAAIILSLTIIVLTCIIPGKMIENVYSACQTHIENAIESAVEGNNQAAHLEAEYIVGEINRAERSLLLFYDHSDIKELSRSAQTALDLSETDDPAQLIAELNSIRKCFEYLVSINKISIYNIF